MTVPTRVLIDCPSRYSSVWTDNERMRNLFPGRSREFDFRCRGETSERLRRVDVGEHAVARHLDLGDRFGIRPDQMAGADIAGDLAHLRDKALGPQHRIAALAVARRHDDGAALDGIERAD